MPPLTATAQNNPSVPNGVASTAAVTAALQRILSAGTSPMPDIVAALGTEPLDWLGKFYAQRRNAPLWVSDTGPMPEAGLVLDRMPEALPVSLQPLLAVAAARRHATDPGALAELDLLASAIYGAAAVSPQDPTATQGAGQALFRIDGVMDLQALLRETLPVDPGFWRLRDAFSAYRALAAAGGWGSVPDGPKLELGAAGPRVDALRRRLVATADLAPTAPATGASRRCSTRACSSSRAVAATSASSLPPARPPMRACCGRSCAFTSREICPLMRPPTRTSRTSMPTRISTVSPFPICRGCSVARWRMA